MSTTFAETTDLEIRVLPVAMGDDEDTSEDEDTDLDDEEFDEEGMEDGDGEDLDEEEPVE